MVIASPLMHQNVDVVCLGYTLKVTEKKQVDKEKRKGEEPWAADEELSVMLGGVAKARKRAKLMGKPLECTALNLLLPSSELPLDQTVPHFHSFFDVAMCQLLPLCVQVKYGPVAKVVSGMFHDKDPANFPFKRTGKMCSDKLRNMEKTYQKEYKRGRHHKAQMSVNCDATQENGAEVGEHMGTGCQLFDEFYLAMHHHLPTDPAHQQALGLVDESDLSDNGEEEGKLYLVMVMLHVLCLLCCTYCVDHICNA